MCERLNPREYGRVGGHESRPFVYCVGVRHSGAVKKSIDTAGDPIYHAAHSNRDRLWFIIPNWQPPRHTGLHTQKGDCPKHTGDCKPQIALALLRVIRAPGARTAGCICLYLLGFSIFDPWRARTLGEPRLGWQGGAAAHTPSCFAPSPSRAPEKRRLPRTAGAASSANYVCLTSLSTFLSTHHTHSILFCRPVSSRAINCFARWTAGV